jgi:hypothetical protein
MTYLSPKSESPKFPHAYRRSPCFLSRYVPAAKTLAKPNTRPKRSSAVHNPEAKTPVPTKSNRATCANRRPVTWPALQEYFRKLTVIHNYAVTACSSNIEMAPLCNIEMTLFRVSGSREKRHDGAVDEQAGIQPA